MNKLCISLLLLLISCSKAFCDSVLIVPFAVYDYNNVIVKLEESPEERVFEELHFYNFGGLIDFRYEGNKYPSVYTITDANKVCSVGNSDYALYGYIQKNENSWYGNLKLYDYSKKKIVKEFFASDDLCSYDRFLSVLCKNILSGLEEISGYMYETTENMNYKSFNLGIGVGISYWSPVTVNWLNAITGIGGGQLDLKMFIPHKRIGNNKIEFDFSIDLRANYSYGFGKEGMYPLNFHIVQVALPLIGYMKIDGRNNLYAGAGLFFEYDYLDIIERYSDRASHYQNLYGLEGIIGYQFEVNSKVHMFCDTIVDFHFCNDSYISVRPGLGMILILSGGSR